MSTLISEVDTQATGAVHRTACRGSLQWVRAAIKLGEVVFGVECRPGVMLWDGFTGDRSLDRCRRGLGGAGQRSLTGVRSGPSHPAAVPHAVAEGRAASATANVAYQ